MLLHASTILKARKQQLVIINEFLAARDTFKYCTLTNIVFLNSEPIMIIESNFDYHVRNGIFISLQIQLNSDHPEYLRLRRDLIRIKVKLREDSYFSVKSIRIIPTEEKIFRDQMDMYQVLIEELEMDKLVDELICLVKGVTRS
jgi:hypothetical protein